MSYQELRLVVVNMETGELEPVVLTLARSAVPGAAACLLSHLEDMWGCSGEDYPNFPDLMRMAEEIVADIGAELEEEYCCGICQLYFPVTDALYRYGACGIRVCEACKEDPRRTRCTVS